MTLEPWIAFVVASAVVLVIPGPTILTVTSYSVTHGWRANVPLVFGVALGDSTAAAASLFGLGALLSASAFWFTVVKWIGGMYLIHLGIKSLRAAGASSADLASPALSTARWKMFANTYVVTALNPKSIIFFVAFLPQFVDQNANVARQLVVLAVTFVVMAAINATLYTVFAASAPKAAGVAARSAALQPRRWLVTDGCRGVGTACQAQRITEWRPRLPCRLRGR